MFKGDDHAYYLRREREERIAAAVATHPAARRAHLDMAERYHNLNDVLAIDNAVAWAQKN